MPDPCHVELIGELDHKQGPAAGEAGERGCLGQNTGVRLEEEVSRAPGLVALLGHLFHSRVTQTPRGTTGLPAPPHPMPWPPKAQDATRGSVPLDKDTDWEQLP